jgi:hypothetical protein
VQWNIAILRVVKSLTRFLNFIVCPSYFLLSSDQCVILLSISTSPESVVFGMASTAEEAYKSVATNALDHLKIMTA